MPRTIPVTLNFHPDAKAKGERTIERIAREGCYRSQFETGTSNGGLTALAKGDRWEWESTIFGGAYDDADPALRPKYGALNHTHSAFGGSPRFGSCHFRLSPHVLERTTFCYPDSHLNPTDFGVADRMALIDLAEANSLDLDPVLDNYVEAHIHGPIGIEEDIDAVVLDPSYRGTATEQFASQLKCDVEWHSGFELQLEKLLDHEGFRPEPALKAITDLKIRTPADIGAAREKDLDYQTAKWVWHCVARFGHEV
ncbi:MAG: DUF3626 domain-containing protein [Pseudomonadota bacterium]